ncbi:MAG: nucleotidyl transferase AbiEii/AbiGii toxin family protein [Acidobacteria bacterium]|nr:nucleotidyl transferase AbiEii/AbiGii toxin family protein [Acidobacteriota bacterium]
MTPKNVRNLAASHRAKLLALSRSRAEDFQFVLGRWIVERFLYRLAISAHKGSFVLKGAMLFLAWEGRLHRPTRDLDLLGFGSPDMDDVARRIREVCSVPANDGIVFALDGIEGQRIKEGAEYQGVRVSVPASLDGARISMQIDVGFGDLVDPPPMELEFPVLLPLEPPVLRAYPPEAVIAEKFHAMAVLGIANSRMKDFFDIWTLSRSHPFDLAQLSRSIRGTFERRRSDVPETLPIALTAGFLEDPTKQTQWAAFGKRLALPDLPPLRQVGEQIGSFLGPALRARIGTVSTPRTWLPGGPWSDAVS